VDSLAHLNPEEPPAAQVSTFPVSSVILTIVLLNQAKICACHICTTFLVFFDFLACVAI